MNTILAASTGLENLTVPTNFGIWDWTIVTVFLVASTILGLWAMKYIRDMEDYVVAGRGIRTYLGVASLISTELGLVTVMYSAQVGFTSAFASFAVAVIAAVAAVVVGFTGFIVVPLRRMEVMTIPEFYERRFSRGVRLAGGAILAFAGILNMGMFLKADSLFVTSVMGMNSEFHLKIAMTIILGLVLLYTMLGGMIAVVFTDYLQYVVMAIGLVAISILLMAHFTWDGLVKDVTDLKGEAGFNPFDAGSKLGGSYLLWMLALGFVSACIWQTAVMRATSAESIKVVRRTYTWGAVGFLIRFLIPYFWGVCALVFVSRDPHLREIFLPAGGEASPDVQLRAMPITLSFIVPAGVIGLLTAGMLAAAMSTYNTYLHTWSAVLTQDVINPLTGLRLSSKARILIVRVIMCLIAIFLLIWGLWYPLGERLWDYMAVTGAIYFTGAFAVLVGGIYWKRASTAGAYAAFACGFAMIMGLQPVQVLATVILIIYMMPVFPHALDLPTVRGLLPVNWPSQYVGLSVLAAAFIAMLVFSLAVPNRPKEA